VIFTYLDAGDWQLGRLRQFLIGHQPLWRGVPGLVAVRFVTPDPDRGSKALGIWQPVLCVGDEYQMFATVDVLDADPIVSASPPARCQPAGMSTRAGQPDT
jgi:hypothetical protein